MEEISIKEETPSIEKTLEAIKDNTKITLKIKIKGNNFIISTEKKDSLIPKIYEGISSKQEIQKNKYFLGFDTLDEILDELISKSKSESPKLIEEHDYLIIKFFLSSSSFNDLEFILKPKSKNSEDKFKELYDIISELKKEINNLKNENVQLKEQMRLLIDFKQGIEEEKKLKQQKNLLEKSKILNGSWEKIDKIKGFISSDKYFDSELKYRMTRDGVDFTIFHRLCDNISPNLLLIKDNKNNIFGGFTKVSWEKRDCKKNDPESFLFSLNKNMKYCPKNKGSNHIFCYKDRGPWFNSGDIGFCSEDMSFCKSYGSGDYLNQTLSTNEAGSYFPVQEVEFYKIIL